MSFRVGQKIVCVDASPARSESSTQLSLHAIYTIRGFDPESDPSGLYLEELPDDPTPEPYEFPVGWTPSRFRPLVERKTDISIFTEMLGPQRELALTAGQRDV